MPLFSAYYTALGRVFDDIAAYAAASGTTTTVVIAALISNVAGVNPNASANRFDGFWSYNATKGQQRLVLSGGYGASTGTLTFAPVATAASASDAIKLTRLFPVIEDVLSDETSYRTITNRALGRMGFAIESEIAITTSDTYPLTAFPSLDRPERLLEVREPAPVASRAAISSMWRGWELVPDPPIASLRVNVPFASTTGAPNVTIERIVPANCWIAVPTTFAESAVGLVSETDQAIPSVEEWLPFAIDEACGILLARGATAPNGRWADLRERARADIARSRYRDLTQERAQVEKAA